MHFQRIQLLYIYLCHTGISKRCVLISTKYSNHCGKVYIDEQMHARKKDWLHSFSSLNRKWLGYWHSATVVLISG